ncbi:TetR family transcriptional regulator [Gordonia terrae]|uniref:TetR family transcriptional regulator n=2 Tax=Gordonia terrae TaxID=2055 RepID=A0AAD0K9V2_9ACTN|nr:MULTISPECIES: TetR family transcriptional regulator [Gordonia]VTR08113.1 transcriptional regulator, TetR family [Clostridioides difficile]ANY25233.1 TetR family transcriptional regulator [Gordonia terrae]AWO85983.1 TetR family transcriptional regulator [Gordonia terrae]VTS62319.1 Rut operon repressor [Gordonia terrae]GAB45582.1 putative TetR family transcriptional regulator [Gordonia terrae NBRC 100016]
MGDRLTVHATSDAPGPIPGRRIGLREKNKMRTRNAIRQAALTLIAEQGYAKTTVEQIAEAAGVSHTTFFRYFPSKEQVVIGDEHLHAEAHAIVEAMPPGLSHFDLIRRLMTELHRLTVDDPWVGNPLRMQLIRTEPLLQKTFQVESERMISDMTQLIADYLGVAPDDFRLKVFLDAVAGVTFHLATELDDNREVPQLETTLRAIDLLEQGLPVGSTDPSDRSPGEHSD